MGAFISFTHKADWNVEYSSIIDKNRDETQGRGKRNLSNFIGYCTFSVCNEPHPPAAYNAWHIPLKNCITAAMQIDILISIYDLLL